MASPRALKPDTRVADYRIVDTVSASVHGLIYLAVVEDSGEEVWLQEFLPSELAGRHRDTMEVRPKRGKTQSFEEALALFLKEARILSQIRDPHVVRVREYSEARGTAFMVMDVERGQSLEQHLEQYGPPENEAAHEFLAALLAGLRVVHTSNLLHRDINLGTIHLTPDLVPILTRFGNVQRALTSSDVGLEARVTPGYSPIEQYHQQGNLGPWTDFYSVGATLYKCITGITPADATQRLIAVAEGNSDPLVPATSIVGDRYDDNLLRCIETMLEPVIDRRPGTATEILDTLNNPEPVASEMDTPVEDDEDEPVAILRQPELRLNQPMLFGDPETRQAHDEKPRSSKLVAWAAGALVVAVILLFAIWPQFQPAEETAAKLEGTDIPGDIFEKPIPEKEAAPDLPAQVEFSRKADDLRADEYRQMGKFDRKIRALLKSARAKVTAGKLVLPPMDNAFADFRSILVMDIDNFDALEGIDQVASMTLQRAREAFAQGQFRDAWLQLNALEQTGIDPNGTSTLKAELLQEYPQAAEVVDDLDSAGPQQLALPAIDPRVKSEIEREKGELEKIRQAKLAEQKKLEQEKAELGRIRQAKLAEQQRLEIERAEQERLRQAKLEEQERLQAERDELERLRQTKLEQQQALEQQLSEQQALLQTQLLEQQQQSEQQLNATKLAEQQKLDQERIEQRQRTQAMQEELKRLEEEKAELERVSQARLEEQKRLEEERAELERIRQAKLAEQERLEIEKAEQAIIAQAKLAEQKLLEQEKQELEKLRQTKLAEQEIMKQAKLFEQKRLEREKAELESIRQAKLAEQEQLQAEKAELERIRQAMLVEQEKLQAQKVEVARIEQAKLEVEKALEQGKAEQERIRQAKLAEQERLQAEKAEVERVRLAKLEAQKALEQDKAEQQRIALAKLAEQEKLEQDRAEQQRLREAKLAAQKELERLEELAEEQRAQQERLLQQQQAILQLAAQEDEQRAAQAVQDQANREAELKRLEQEKLVAQEEREQLQKLAEQQRSQQTERARQDRLDNLMAKAKQAEDNGNLVDSPGSDALSYYREALSIDPDHTRAARAISDIAAYHVNKAIMALSADRFEETEELLDTVALIEPQNESIELLRSQLELREQKLEEEKQAAELAAKKRREEQAALEQKQRELGQRELEQGINAYYRGDYELAFKILRPLAEDGNTRAQFRVGVMYLRGRGTDRNPREGENWVRRAFPDIQSAATANEAWAQADLGALYQNGLLVAQNNIEAARWYLLAANQGYAGAQTNLGTMYARGAGVTRDRDEAIKWLRRAAEQGDRIAQRNLAALGVQGTN